MINKPDSPIGVGVGMDVGVFVEVGVSVGVNVVDGVGVKVEVGVLVVVIVGVGLGEIYPAISSLKKKTMPARTIIRTRTSSHLFIRTIIRDWGV